MRLAHSFSAHTCYLRGSILRISTASSGVEREAIPVCVTPWRWLFSPVSVHTFHTGGDMLSHSVSGTKWSPVPGSKEWDEQINTILWLCIVCIVCVVLGTEPGLQSWQSPDKEVAFPFYSELLLLNCFLVFLLRIFFFLLDVTGTRRGRGGHFSRVASSLLEGAMFSRKETDFSSFKCLVVFICSVLRAIQFKVKFSGDPHNIWWNCVSNHAIFERP